MATATVEGLPPPVLAGGSVSSRRTNRKRVRVDRGLAAHWARLKRRMGTGTAPSTSSHVYETSAGDSSVYLHRTCLKRPEEEEDCGEVDEVVVDRQWSDEIKSTVPSENGGNGHERSGGGSHTVGHDKAGASGGGGGGAGAGTSTDRDSFAWRADGVWSSWFPLIVLRYRLWPVVLDFFSTRFADVESERHFRKEGWFFRKSLALGSALFFVVNWVLSSAFTPKVGITDKVFIWGFQTLLTIPIPLLVMYDYPRDHQFFYQAWLAVSTWSWPTYSVIYMYLCGFYSHNPITFTCGTKDFLLIFYFTSAMQTIALFGLQLHRLSSFIGAVIWFCLASALLIPDRTAWIRNVLQFAVYEVFLLYVHYMRENSERRMYSLREQLKVQFRATQKAQVNERKASDSKRRLTSYVFHEVRVPLNTALLAVQNMEAEGTVPKAQEIEFKALTGSLSMMSKVLNDVLDFNRMDSGKFESVSKPYAFHQVMQSMFIPLRLATDARQLEFVTELDENIDLIARRAAYEALGLSPKEIAQRLRERADSDSLVVGDETRLRQIITNLASNACKFTPAGGRLTIRTRLMLPHVPPQGFAGAFALPEDEGVTPISEGTGASMDEHRKLGDTAYIEGSVDHGEAARHRLSTTHVNQHNLDHSPPSLGFAVVRIEVADTGTGLRPKDMVQSKLFSAFNQTEAGRQQGGKGTGLGLALVRQIVKLSGGRLGVKSKSGENSGSCFWVELPLAIGVHAISALSPVEQEVLKMTRAVDRPMRNRTSSTATTPKTNSQNSRISSALVSIMEQGGLVELVPGRRQASGTVVTRMLGDPSTGTAPSPLMPENSVEAAGAPHRPPMLMHVSSEQTAVASPLDERAYLALPDTPRFSSEEAPSPTEASHTPRSGSVMKATEFNGLPVLVVDDDPLTRMLMKRMLTRLGCRVTTAENGELALQRILGEDARASQPPDITDAGVEEKFAIVFLDNQMPVMSGLEAVGRLRDAGRSDFVVGVTGNALLSDQEEYLDAGADHVLTKPVLERNLRHMLNMADERRRLGGSAPDPQPLEPDMSTPKGSTS